MTEPRPRRGCLFWAFVAQTAMLIALGMGLGLWACRDRIAGMFASAPQVNDPNPVVWYDTEHECEIRPFGAMESTKGWNVLGRLNGDTRWQEVGTNRVHYDWHPSVTVGRKLKPKSKTD